MQNLAAVFYANGRFLASLQPSRLKEALEVSMGLFNRVVLRKNVKKMVSMVFQKYRT